MRLLLENFGKKLILQSILFCEGLGGSEVKKMLVLLLLILVSGVSSANIVELFESIPPIIKYSVGAGIALYGLSWACSWIFDPIVVVGEFSFAPSSFGPLIFMHSKIWYSDDCDTMNLAMNHEYVHFVQQAFWGPVFHLSYPIFYLYSHVKHGNQWTSNPWEQEAFAIQTIQKPKWKPSLVIEF